MLAVFPLLAFVLLAATAPAFLPRRQHATPLRSSLLAAAVIWGVLTAAITEILSAANALHTEWLGTAWGLVCLVIAGDLAWHRLFRQNTARYRRGGRPRPPSRDAGEPPFVAHATGRAAAAEGGGGPPPLRARSSEDVGADLYRESSAMGGPAEIRPPGFPREHRSRPEAVGHAAEAKAPRARPADPSPPRLPDLWEQPARRGLASLIAAATAFALLVGFVALVAAPNDTDSMKYHLMRVVHWMQDGSVGMFPSEYLPQLYQPPWAEYAQLHLMSLSGGDHLAGVVQWSSFVLTGIAVSLIARCLGADEWGQALAAVAALAMPVAILQASTAQNADVVTCWVACAVYYFLVLREGGCDWRAVGLLGGSAGLAVLTKGTAYVYLLPLGIWYLIWAGRALGLSLWKPTAAMALVIVALNAPFLARNISLFGQPLGPEGSLYTNAVFGVRPLISNLVRNLALQLGTPDAAINHGLESAIDRFHSLLGLGVNDPRTTWINHVFHVNPLSLRESTAGNPLQLLLAAAAMVTAMLTALRRQRLVVVYGVAVLAGFAIFCIYLKWQPWNSRLHLPFLALCCPIIGLVFARILPRWGTVLMASTLLLVALPWVLKAQARPVLGAQSILVVLRTDQYFASLPALEPAYLRAARFTGEERCTSVGLLWGSVAYQFEYPLWVVLRQQVGDGLAVEDVHVDNASHSLENQVPFAGFHPCAIVSVGLARTTRTVRYHGAGYHRTMEWGAASVFLPG